MNGAEALLGAAAAAGIDVCFANPGTTEMDLVTALDHVPEIRPVLGLFEGVCTGAADGFGRMADRPALTLLHLGPGFANGIANLHNARRAKSPVLNLVGDHATWHRGADAPLTSDIHSLARPVSAWVRTSRSAERLVPDLADAMRAACGPPGGVSTLVVPQDLLWSDAVDQDGDWGHAESERPADVERAAELLRERGDRSLLWLGGRSLRADGLWAAHRIAAATGCRVRAEPFPARVERGAGVPAVEPLPYFPEQAAADLDGVDAAVLCGAAEPVAFFGYPSGESRLLPRGCEQVRIDPPGCWADTALIALVDVLGAPDAPVSDASAVEPPSGDLSAGSLGRAVSAAQVEDAIVVNEAATTSRAWRGQSAGAPPHTELTLTGGAIGFGLPAAVGAAVACPDRRVIALQADGSGLYTSQALWTMARESLDITVLVCANHKYRILQHELSRAGVDQLGPAAGRLTDLREPVVDWVALATGYGVPARRADTADQLNEALSTALGSAGPSLVEAVI